MIAGNQESHGEKSAEAAVIDIVIRLALLGLLAYWAGLLIAPFVILVVWAIILAVAVYPLYNWLRARLGGRGSLASLLVTLIGLAIILGPAVVLSSSLIDTAQTVSSGLRDGTLIIAPPPETVRDWPLIGDKIHGAWSHASNNLSGFINKYAATILAQSGAVAGSIAGIGGSVLGFAVSIIIAAFLYGRGPALAEAASHFAARIAERRGVEFVQLAGATIRNVSRGVIGISFLQATLAGIGLIVAGIPAAGLIALVVLVLGIIQIGPGLVLFPVIIWVWTAMDTMTALLFTIYMVPVALVDNVLKPIVMAKGLKTPMLVIFIGVIGGTLAHGLIGLFLGPIVLAVFYDLLIAWVRGRVVEAEEEQPE
jgi:predicted PurR-regulated permease PerM